MMRTVAIVQARTGSTRLPGKVLEDLAGMPLLVRMMERARRARRLDDIVVATTTLASDDTIETLCRSRGWHCFRGHPTDLLDRYRQAALQFGAEAVVRLTADCPLIDPDIIDRLVGEFLAGQPELHYASTDLPAPSFPRGLDAEIVRIDALDSAWREDTDPAWREHATPYIYRHPERYRLGGIVNDADRSTERWTVDTAEDLALVRRIYQHFGHDRFGWREVLTLLDANPEWRDLNRHVRQRPVA